MKAYNNKKIGFIIDSSATLTKKHDDVELIPLVITVTSNNQTTSYRDNFKDLKKDEMFKLIKQKGVDVRTSQANMQDMMQIADKMTKEYDYVVVLPINTYLSSNFNTWKMIASDYTNLHVIELNDICSGIEDDMEQIKEYLSKNEFDAKKLQEYVDKNIKDNYVGFLLLDNIDQLKKGGRVSALKAFVAKLLKLKILVIFNKNGLTFHDKVKSISQYYDSINEYIEKNHKGKKIDKISLYTSDIKLNDIANKVISEYKDHYKLKFDTVCLPTVVTAHTGLDCTALYFRLK